jgi:hypothetical protein
MPLKDLKLAAILLFSNLTSYYRKRSAVNVVFPAADPTLNQ